MKSLVICTAVCGVFVLAETRAHADVVLEATAYHGYPHSNVQLLVGSRPVPIELARHRRPKRHHYRGEHYPPRYRSHPHARPRRLHAHPVYRHGYYRAPGPVIVSPLPAPYRAPGFGVYIGF